MANKYDFSGIDNSTDALSEIQKLGKARDRAKEAGAEDAVKFFEDKMSGLTARLKGGRNAIEWRRDDIHKNKPLMDDARKVMKSYKGVTLRWTDEEVNNMSNEQVAEEYDDMMRSFEHNTGSMANLWVQADDWDPKAQVGLLNMMDSWGNVETTTSGVIENIGELAMDPATWASIVAGVFTAGTGTAAGFATKEAAKLAAKKAMKIKLRSWMAKNPGKAVALEGATINAGHDWMYTGTQEDAGREFKTSERVVSAGLQGAIGGVVGGALGGGLGKLARRSRSKGGKQTLDDIAFDVAEENRQLKGAHSIANSRQATGDVGENLGRLAGRLTGKESALVRGANWLSDKTGKIPIIGPGTSRFAKGLTETAGGAAKNINKNAAAPGQLWQGVKDLAGNVAEGAGKIGGHTIAGNLGELTGVTGGRAVRRLAIGKVGIGLAQEAAGLASGVARLALHSAGGLTRGAYQLITKPNTWLGARRLAKDKNITSVRSPQQMQDEIARRAYNQGLENGVADGSKWRAPGRDYIEYSEEGAQVGKGPSVDKGIADQNITNQNLANKFTGSDRIDDLRPKNISRPYEALLDKIQKDLEDGVALRFNKPGKNATNAFKVRYKLSTDGTVSIKDLNLDKTELSDVMSGKSIVSINKKTGEAVPCPK